MIRLPRIFGQLRGWPKYIIIVLALAFLSDLYSTVNNYFYGWFSWMLP